MTRFSIGPKPDPNADLNYFFPYLEWLDHRRFDATPTAGWFSHHDTDNARKAKHWTDAAAAMSLRLTSARLYEAALEPYGPTAVVTPLVDHNRFRPGELLPYPRRRVGFSGVVYPGGRKGEHLARRLVESSLSSEVDFVASGKGWPCPTMNYLPLELPDFYRSLSVYVCTSTIEGIPMPPLECLACGIPIVIPRGVGLLDELPDAQNVYRYRAGDYEELELCVRRALLEDVNRESLTGIAGRFTNEAWAESHWRAFERFLYDDPLPTDLPEWEGRAGVYYVAYGEQARDCATKAIRSLQQWMPTLPAALVSDEPLGPENVFVRHNDMDIGGRHVKTKIYDLAPVDWEYVLYLDADTEVVAPIDFLVNVLVSGWELVICTNPAQYHLAREMRRPDNQGEIDETFDILGSDEILQLNGGVFGFRRCDRVKRFFDRWHTEWMRYGKRDQAALDRALYAEPLRVYVVGQEWNTVTRYTPAERTAGILHYPLTARRWRGIIKGRLDGGEAWAALHPEPGREPPGLRKGNDANYTEG